MHYELDAATGNVIETQYDGYGSFEVPDNVGADLDSSVTVYTFAIDAVF